MLHYTCDVCGTELGDRRYMVKIQVQPAFDPDAISEEDLDVDHLEAIAELLADESTESQLEDATRKFRYDLCSHCHDNYCRDPLNKDMLRRLDFSEN